MMVLIDEEQLRERANNLGTRNGIDFVLVNPSEPFATLDVYFHNSSRLDDIVNAFASGTDAKEVFPVRGGHRVRGGPRDEDVNVAAIQTGSEPRILRLQTNRIGDYSTYTLEVQFEDIDPVFSEIRFKFRPGCFTTDCAPQHAKPQPPPPSVPIDYLAKDFESFRHTLVTALRTRVPGWEPTSETDMTQVLINLFSASADELSDFQDRVMAEAYLGRARKRVSLARHARLMDYHIDEGNQASTWLALTVAHGAQFTLEAGFETWASATIDNDRRIVFTTQEAATLHHLLNSLELYTWQGARPGLAAGSITADIAMVDEATALAIQHLIDQRIASRFLIEEHRSPVTGAASGHNINKRQIVQLEPSATVMRDPALPDVADGWFVRVRWRSEDALAWDFCAVANLDDGSTVDGVFLFHGNLARTTQGEEVRVTFKEPSERLNAGEFHYERSTDPQSDVLGSWKPSRTRSVLCRLPRSTPLLYRRVRDPTRASEVPPESTLSITVRADTVEDEWQEVSSLVHSDESATNFAVETDENRSSVVRFGNGVLGRELPDNAEVLCKYQTGFGPDGNIGADRLVHFDSSAHPEVEAVRNPFDITDGRAAEPPQEIVRNAVEAWKSRQLRAVSLGDYRARAEEVPGVSRAAASYAWTGSWRAVRIAIDPLGRHDLGDDLRHDIAAKLESVRLIGDDIEIRQARFVPLTITISLCVRSDVWPEDIRFLLLEEFSDAYTSNGDLGFFHPDRWTFGQPLQKSQIIGRVHRIEGVHHVISVSMRRFDEQSVGTADVLQFGPNEILQVRNDPDHMEQGSITFEPLGGRA